jgi:uncharacterized protein
MDKLSHIKQVLKENRSELREKFGIAELGIFGSYVRGEQEATSDLDRLVTFSEPKSLFQFIRIEDHLSELLGVKVDLVMKNTLKPRIGKTILGEVQLI